MLYLTDSLAREVIFACFAAATIPAIADRLTQPSADALVAAADQAMYERKRAKRHTAAV